MKEINNTYLADWLVGKLSDEELIEIAGEDALISYKKIISTVDKWQTPLRKTGHKNELMAKVASPQQEEFSIKRWFAIAAIILIIIGAFDLISPKTYRNNSGEPKEYTLTDGTNVTLEANSQIKFSKIIWLFQRSITAEGNLYFEVAKGSKFTITSPHGIVQILGTKFRIIDRLNYYQVCCHEGEVNVKSKDFAEVKLIPGKSIDNRQKVICDFNANINKSQMTKFLYYERIPVSVVIEDLKAIYDINITYTKLEKELYFSGRLPRDNQQTAITTLLAPFHLELKTVSDNEFEILPQSHN